VRSHLVGEVELLEQQDAVAAAEASEVLALMEDVGADGGEPRLLERLRE
jgi:hypothetical protein